MNIIDKLAQKIGGAVLMNRDNLTEIRLRANRRSLLRLLNGEEISGPVFIREEIQSIACMLMDESIYAREEELKEGFFTAQGGCRVGVCGKMVVQDGRISGISSIGSLCIRIPREIRGCADSLLPLFDKGRITSILIVSRPGLGKTTLIRELSRCISDAGFNVAIADERREICACIEGIPQLDVGSHTDVMEGCPKRIAVPQLIRACAPDLIVVDEIGGENDADVLQDAARCGVAIVATAHAGSVEEAFQRRSTGTLLKNGVFHHLILMGDKTGEIKEIKRIVAG